MSLQGHDRAAQIIADALSDEAEAVDRLLERATDPAEKQALSIVSIMLARLSFAFGEAGNRMDAEMRAACGRREPNNHNNNASI